MAFIKFKELTKYFNFNKEIDKADLPKYVMDYVDKGETIYKAYKTFRDKALFTDKRMILFDVDPVNRTKKIHIIPYHSISSAAIAFNGSRGAILLTLDSGYQMRLNFVHMNSEDKGELRKLYTQMMSYLIKSEK